MTVVVFQRASYEEETRPFKVLQEGCAQTFVYHPCVESGRQRRAKARRFAVSPCKPRRPLRGSVRGRNFPMFLAPPFWGRPTCAKPKLRFGGGRGDGEGGNFLEGAWSYMERYMIPGEGRKCGGNTANKEGGTASLPGLSSGLILRQRKAWGLINNKIIHSYARRRQRMNHCRPR